MGRVEESSDEVKSKEPVALNLSEFLSDRAPAASDLLVWGERMRLQATAYVSDQAPPLDLITSVRAIVLLRGEVLLQQDQANRHILPGGRREEGESLDATLRREVAEETGWTLRSVRLLGFMHLRHHDPKPPGYAFPYPDFCWLIHLAEAVDFSPHVMLDDGYEVNSEFVTIDQVRALPLPVWQRVYLEAALKSTPV
jgi:ADP-ribose pyrophosphatase YjhB (NUDIX family)